MNLDKIWLIKFKLAKKYYEYHGNLRIPQNFKTNNGYLYKDNENSVDLGYWLRYQRYLFKQGKLSEDKVLKLESIGIKWVTFLEWNDYFKLAKNYYEKHHNLDIPERFRTINGYEEDKSDESIKLGNWIQNTRQSYKKGLLDDDKIQKLESIGMNWYCRNNYSWDEMYFLADCYYNYHHHLNVPVKYVTINGYLYEDNPDSIKLGVWIHEQRRLYKMGLLDEDRIKKLESIKMIWSVRRPNNEKEKIDLCREYGLDITKYPFLLQMPYKVLYAKILFINENNLSIKTKKKLNPIFFMSDINMQVTYGISLKDLINKYFSNENRRKK